MSRLLRERGVARFIVAPDGYGKTTLALEYAEVVFSWAHVFWINGKSPCFMRDLDAGSLASDCLSCDPHAALVVFEDVPSLDSARTQAFSAQLDQLIAAGCEALVTCAPAHDAVIRMQRDCVCLRSVDLLLDDDELDGARSGEEAARLPAYQIGAASRVPALVWATADHVGRTFANSCFGEEVSGDVLLAFATMFLLQSAPLEVAGELCPSFRGVMDLLSEDYPHLGIDAESGRFDAPRILVEDLAVPLKKHLDNLAIWAQVDDKEHLVVKWADALSHEGGWPRACDIMRLLGSRAQRIDWVLAQGWEIVRAGCTHPCLKLVRTVASQRHPDRLRVLLLEAWLDILLGGEERAVHSARRVAVADGDSAECRLAAWIVLARYANGETRLRACSSLQDECSALGTFPADTWSLWQFLALACLAASRGVGDLAWLWDKAHEAGCDDDGLAIVASWLFQAVQQSVAEGFDAGALERSEPIRRAQSYVRMRLADTQGSDFYVNSAALSLEQAHLAGFSLAQGMFDAATMIALRNVELDLLRQRHAYQGDCEDRARTREMHAITHPDAYVAPRRDYAPRVELPSVPPLTVRLFGRFDVSVGGKWLDPKRFRRRKVQTLLAMLVVQSGREMSRDRIVELLWPTNITQNTRKNYYSLMSQLRRALQLPDGTCPYILNHQMGASVDDRIVSSDLARCKDICRSFLFDEPEPHSWTQLYRELDRDFSADILPSELSNPLIVQTREDMRARLVDALVSGTVRIVEAGYPEWGIWFARSALSRDITREDVYAALMKAQAACGQRTAALSTFLECKRVLNRELGVDPSTELVALYESILA